MMITVACGAWVKCARSTPEAGTGARVPTATVSPSRTSRAMAHAISSSLVERAASAVDVAIEIALEGGVVRRGGDVFAHVIPIDRVHAADERRVRAARRLDEGRDVDALEDHAVGDRIQLAAHDDPFGGRHDDA